MPRKHIRVTDIWNVAAKDLRPGDVTAVGVIHHVEPNVPTAGNVRIGYIGGWIDTHVAASVTVLAHCESPIPETLYKMYQKDMTAQLRAAGVR